MAISIYPNTTEIIGLQEFRRRVREKVDPRRPESMLDVAEDLIALANDKRLMARGIAADLRDIDERASGMYTPQSYLLDTFDMYSVRINTWKASQSLSDAETTYFSYKSYHNHDFPFITANYYGPGYRTSIYEGHADWRSVGPGQAATLSFLEETDLPPGKVMYYRKWLDVHSQLPPEEESASINLMLDDTGDLARNQFYFEPITGEIIGRVENTVAKRLAALEIGRFLGSIEAAAELKRLAAETFCRATADKAAQIATLFAKEGTTRT